MCFGNPFVIKFEMDTIHSEEAIYERNIYPSVVTSGYICNHTEFVISEYIPVCVANVNYT